MDAFELVEGLASTGMFAEEKDEKDVDEES